MHPVARAARRCLIKQAQFADLVDAEAFVSGASLHARVTYRTQTSDNRNGYSPGFRVFVALV